MPCYVRLLNGFGIPYVVIYDLDHQSSKAPHAVQSADNASGRIESVINSSLGKSVVFNNDFEEELGIPEKPAKSKAYQAVSYILSDGFALPDALRTKMQAIYQE